MNETLSKKDLLAKYAGERVKVDKWCRCMGYYRPVVAYNIGKKAEFAERVFFRVKKH